MTHQTTPFEEHAYRERLENEDEMAGTPVRMPMWVTLAIAAGLSCLCLAAALVWDMVQHGGH